MKKFAFKSVVIGLCLSLSFCLFGCGGSETVEDVLQLPQFQSQNNNGQPPGPAPVLGFRVVNSFPHQTNAFTQGLLFENGRLYESTGLVGQSSLREVELTSGTVIRQIPINNVFAEGLASRNGLLYQLTLDSNQAFVWGRDSFSLSSTLEAPNPSWGLALTDQDQFAFSDGTSTLRFLDPGDLSERRRVTVTDNGAPVDLLNELEFINGLVYANRFTTDEIVAIDPDNGVVAFRINLSGIIDKQANGLGANDVLNGIAFDRLTGRLFVTGKRWPNLFQIELVQ